MFRFMSEFLLKTSNQKNTEKQNTVCRHCKVMAPYNGNTTNVHVHLRHHSNIKPDCVTYDKKIHVSQKFKRIYHHFQNTQIHHQEQQT